MPFPLWHPPFICFFCWISILSVQHPHSAHWMVHANGSLRSRTVWQFSFFSINLQVLGLLVWTLIAGTEYFLYPAFGWVMFVAVFYWVLTVFFLIIYMTMTYTRIPQVPWTMVVNIPILCCSRLAGFWREYNIGAFYMYILPALLVLFADFSLSTVWLRCLTFLLPRHFQSTFSMMFHHFVQPLM